jgi:outer membrane protein OmpA-like peptidoglycan-associated protein
MKNTVLPPFVFGFVLLLNSTFLSAQQTKQVIVLINSQPCLVELDANGNITKVIQQEPQALSGYEVEKKIDEALPKVPHSKVLNPDEPPIMIIDKPKVDVDGAVNPIFNYKVSPEVDDITRFAPGEATLTMEARNKLDIVALDMKQNPSDVVVIRSLSINKESKLHLNRVDAVKSYFKIKGIDSNRIIAESLQGRVDADEIKVHIIRNFLR